MSTVRTTTPDPNATSRSTPSTPAATSGTRPWTGYVAALTRIRLGWVFLWAFLDKTFALGHETGVNPKTGATDYFGPAAWVNGGSPTKGFLGFATKGPLADFYQGLAGNVVVDWLFMLALLGIGLALILGIGMRIAITSAVVLLIMMWSAVLPPANNLFMDDHIIYALTLVLLGLVGAGRTWGFGAIWERIPFVRNHAYLK